MPKKHSSHKKPTHRKHSKKRSRNPYNQVLKATTNTTKLAVTGLVGAGMISTTAAALSSLKKS